MSAAGTGTAGGAPRLLVVLVLAVLTTVAAHGLVAGSPPEPLAVVTGVVLAAGAARLADRAGSSCLTSVLTAQVALHVVLALTHPVGCLQAVGRAAAAGLDLAWWSASTMCLSSGLSLGAAQQVALSAVVSALPLLVVHTALTVAGGAWLARLEDAVRAVVALVGAVLVRVIEPVLVPSRPVAVPVACEQVAVDVAVLHRSVGRRGPPVAHGA